MLAPGHFNTNSLSQDQSVDNTNILSPKLLSMRSMNSEHESLSDEKVTKRLSFLVQSQGKQGYKTTLKSYKKANPFNNNPLNSPLHKRNNNEDDSSVQLRCSEHILTSISSDQ